MIPDGVENGQQVIHAGGSCWSDLPIHMSMVHAFLSGRNQDVSWGDMISPVFAGEKMAYPFLPDFHAAIMVKLGSSMRSGFLFPGFLLAVSFFVLLFLMALRVTKSRIAGVFAILLTIGAGGMGGVNIFFRELANANGNIFSALAATIPNDTAQNDVSGDGKVFWFAFLPHVLMPQRGANFAYPMALLVLLLVWQATDTTRAASASTNPAQRRSLLMHAAAFAAALPLVQAHCFIALGIMIGVFFVLDAHKWLADLRLLGGWIAAGLVAVCVGGPQMMLFRGQVERGHGGNFMKQGWIYKNHDFGRSPPLTPEPLGSIVGFFRFWWMSLGPALPLFLLAVALYGYDVFRAFVFAVALKRRGATAYDAFVRSITGVSAAALAAALADAPADAKKSDDASASASASASGSARNRRVGAGSSASMLYAEDHFDKYAVKTHSAASASAGLGLFNNGSGADTTLVEHLWCLSLQQLPTLIADVISDPTLLNITALDRIAAPLNELTINGRALDSLKLACAAFAVFLVGNYINFQPWDRDNCKLFYIWVFVASMLTGALFAAPLEFLLGLAPGSARVVQLTGAGTELVLRVGAAGNAGAKAKDERSEVPAGAAEVGSVRKWSARSLATGLSLSLLAVVPLQTATGLFMVKREFGLFHVLSDHDQIDMGKYIRENVPPRSVVLHRDTHITPSGLLAGRTSLLAYNGWMWSHGYNYYERDRDRNHVLANMLKDSDSETYNVLRRWGVRYVVGEWTPRHNRPRQQEWEEAKKRKEANPSDNSIVVPRFDPDLYLDGMLRRVFTAGRYELFVVEGYGFPPT
jgi:hypothetical protein